jgi:recombination protein RecT
MADTTKAVALQRNVCDEVIARVNKLEQDKMLVLPKDYAVENHLKAAWLILQETVDRNNKPVLEVCTKPSIANCLLDMTLQGLSASKKQCYFVAYGNKLTLMRSYFGTVAIAKRAGNIKTEPIANVVYEGDEFIYEIDPDTGLTRIVKHTQKMENINMQQIKGAYAIVKLANGQTQVTVMSIQQIKAAWAQGRGGGNTKAHTNFTDEMCKKTVIGRACKMVINSSDDAWLYDGKRDEMDASAEREEIINQAEQEESADLPEMTDYEDVTAQPATETVKEKEAQPATEQQTDGLFGNEPY